MSILNLEIVDIVLPLAATLFIAFVSLKTLQGKQHTALEYQREGVRVPWHMRRYLHLTSQELRVDMIGRCVAFFLIIMSMQSLKAFKLELMPRLAVSALIAILLMVAIPPLFVAIYRRFYKNH